VQTAPDTDLVQFQTWILRVRTTTHQTPRLLILIHGLTGDENSMWVFTRDLPSSYWIVAPRAPYTAQLGGYSWRAPQDSDLDRPNLDQLRSSAEALIRLIDAYQTSAGIEADVFDVMGFSQGGAMSVLLAFLYPQRIRKIGILAGFVPSGMEDLVLTRPLIGKQVFVAHGTKDSTVPVDQARASIEVLEQAGAQITYCEDEVGHKVSLNCLHALRKYLAE